MADQNQEQLKGMLEERCLIHKNYPLELICISQNQKNDEQDKHIVNRQICYMCFQNSQLQKDEILNIRQIIYTNEDEIIPYFPPLKDNNLYQSLDDLFKQQIQVDSTIIQVQEYFKDFQKELLQILDNLQQSIKNYIEESINIKKQLVDTYNTISAKNEFKQIFSITQQLERNEKLNQLILQKYNDSQNNTNIINDLVNQGKKYNNHNINLNSPNKFKEIILQLMKRINFFDNSDNHVDINLNQQNSIQQLQEIINNQSLSNSSRTNSKISNQYVQNSNNNLVNGLQNKKSNIDIILELIDNPTNYITETLKQELKQILKKYSQSLNINNFTYPYCNEEKRNAFKNLSESSLNHINILCNEIQNINNQYNNQKNNNTINQQSTMNQYLNNKIQPNSYEICNQLLNGKNHQQYENIEKILRNYPIFDLPIISQIQYQLLFTNLIKSKYADSQNLHIAKNQQLEIEVSKIHKKGHAICYTSKSLEKDNNYIIRLNIQSNHKTNNNLILFGLIPDSSKDIGYLRDTGLTYNERGDSCYTLNKIIQGDPIPEINKLGINKSIEIRININSKIFKIASYPGYENISELDNKNRIKDNISYRFAIELYQQDDKITINEIMVVDKFDHFM